MTLMKKDIEKHQNTIKENNFEQQNSAGNQLKSITNKIIITENKSNVGQLRVKHLKQTTLQFVKSSKVEVENINLNHDETEEEEKIDRQMLQSTPQPTKRAYNELDITVDDTATKRARETDNKTSKLKFSEDFLTEKEFLDQYGNSIFRLTDIKGVMFSLDSNNSKDLQPLRHAEAIVQQLWHFFVAFPIHAAILAEIQSLNDEDHLKLKRVVPTRWLSQTKQACLRIATHQSYTIFPAFQFLAQACLTLPVDNCQPERGFSHMKRIKTPSRNRLESFMLQFLMNIKMNGWRKLTNSKALEIAQLWYKEKDRCTSWKRTSEPGSEEESTLFEQFKLNINEVTELIFE
ncbi:MAG: hypothetical protein EZS28_023319 [Streblomastix strix]|uniref:HAT C-terminal dimerisation domain-containing protein n=1 Tax=Streblomastix strix TaxID=222440 RepID=A0A5J4VFH6_9EUKA|nr:MAG: hypothetical protein EZS28_023319 [Streblomastix strix]